MQTARVKIGCRGEPPELSLSASACDHETVRLGHASAVRPLTLLVALAALFWVAPATGGEAASGAAADLVMKQIALLRSHDFASAYALVSRELRRTFTRSEYEWMVKRAHPEVASSAHAYVVRTRETAGFVYVTVKVVGRNGRHVEALYEIVREGDAFRVNALSSRRHEGVI